MQHDRTCLADPDGEWHQFAMPPFARLFDAFLSRFRILTVDHSYFPKERNWQNAVGIQALARKVHAADSDYLELLAEFAKQRRWLEKIPRQARDGDLTPRWINKSFPGLDAVALYGLLVRHNPCLYVEVGSGNSTKFARRAIDDHRLRTEIVSIDPNPRHVVDAICDRSIRKRCEDVPIDFFAELPNDSILFVDNSHRAFPNSDVAVFFMEILPVLAQGIIWGLHDIHFPFDYPDAWSGRYYNEQYLLLCYLMGGSGNDEILLPNGYISTNPNLSSRVAALFDSPHFARVEQHGSSFWMRRNRKLSDL